MQDLQLQLSGVDSGINVRDGKGISEIAAFVKDTVSYKTGKWK